MNKNSTIILLLFCFLLFTGIAEARLTLGVVGDDDRVRPLADRLAKQLGEEVEIKHLADMETLLNWLERFAMVDLAVLPSEAVATRPGQHLVLGRLGVNAEMSLIVAQGGGGDLPRRLGTLLKESGSVLWGPPAGTEQARTIQSPAKTEGLLSAPAAQEVSTPEIVHLPTLQPGKAWVPQGDIAARDILVADTLPTDKLVLGVVLDPRGPVQTAEQAERLAGYLQSTMQVPVTARVFTRPENLTEWFRRYRMVDLVILRSETATTALEGDYRPLASLFRTTTEPFSLAVARIDLADAVFNPLQAVLIDMVAQKEGQKLLAEMGILSMRPSGVLPESVTLPDQTAGAEVPPSPVPIPVVAKPADPPVVAKPADPPVVAKPADPPVVAKPADPPVVAKPEVPPIKIVQPAAPVAALAPELADEPAPTVPEAPKDLVILPLTPVVTELAAPASPPKLEKALVVPPQVAAAPPAMTPAPQPQETVVATPPSVTLTDKAPPVPELPALPEVPAVIERIEAPATAPPPTLIAAEPAATVALKEPAIVAVVAPAEPLITPPVRPAGPAELAMNETPPSTSLSETAPTEADREELQRIVEERLTAESDTAVVISAPLAKTEVEVAGQQLPFAKQSDDVKAMLGENTVVAMVAQPEIPEGLRPPGIPLLRPGRIPKRAPAEEDKRLVQEMPQPLKKTYVQPPPSLLPEPEPEPGVIYVIPFVSVMVPNEVDGRIFDQFVDILNEQGPGLNLQFVILKEGLQRVDPNWLAARKYVTGEVYAYVEDSGCCSTDLRSKARLTYRRPRQADPAFGFEYPTKRFFDHDLSTLAKERMALADNIAQVLASELLDALKN